MKKLAIGCGIVLLVAAVASAAIGYYVYRQVSSTVAQFAELAQLPDVERAVRNTAPFSAPASEELTDAQLEKLVRVQTEVRRRIGERMTAFEAKYKTLAEKDRAELTDVPALWRAYSDLAAAWLDAKRAQVEALNAADLSLAEYRWIREQTYRALGMPYVDLDIARIVEDARLGVTPEAAGQLRGALEAAGPEANRARVAKLKKVLEENLALAAFGL